MKRRPTPPRRADLPPKPPLPGPPLSVTLELWAHRSGDADAVRPAPAPTAPAAEQPPDPRLPREPEGAPPVATPRDPATIESAKCHTGPRASGTDDVIRLCTACRQRSTFKVDGICTYCAAKGAEAEDKPRQDGGDR